MGPSWLQVAACGLSEACQQSPDRWLCKGSVRVFAEVTHRQLCVPGYTRSCQSGLAGVWLSGVLCSVLKEWPDQALGVLPQDDSASSSIKGP